MFELAEYLQRRTDLAGLKEAWTACQLVARRLDWLSVRPSPILWSSLSDTEVAEGLRRIARWTQQPSGRQWPGSGQLRQSCYNLAEQLDRARERRRDSWER